MNNQDYRIATNLLVQHDCQNSLTKLARENCGACVLNGYGDKVNGEPIAPNYSGWARIYVQACKQIPRKYAEAFLKELQSDNFLYREALAKDIINYGVIIL